MNNTAARRPRVTINTISDEERSAILFLMIVPVIIFSFILMKIINALLLWIAIIVFYLADH